MMDTFTKQQRRLEINRIRLSLSHLRCHPSALFTALQQSLQQHGQQVPVIVVPESLERAEHWILLDGYRRLQVLVNQHQDTVDSEIWHCTVDQALLLLLANHQGHAWEALEEALWMNELIQCYGYSQRTLAQRIGRDSSVIVRRLQLLAGCDELLLSAMRMGAVSTWAATRIVLPMARANTDHAKQLIEHLKATRYSTRQLQQFYQHYQRCNKTVRDHMVERPDLFFSSLIEQQQAQSAQQLAHGPEGKWREACESLVRQINCLATVLPVLFAQPLPDEQRQSLLKPWQRCQARWEQFTTEWRKVQDAAH